MVERAGKEQVTWKSDDNWPVSCMFTIYNFLSLDAGTAFLLFKAVTPDICALHIWSFRPMHDFLLYIPNLSVGSKKIQPLGKLSELHPFFSSRFYKLFFSSFPRISVSIKIINWNSFCFWPKQEWGEVYEFHYHLVRVPNKEEGSAWKNRRQLSTELANKDCILEKRNTIWTQKRNIGEAGPHALRR